MARSLNTVLSYPSQEEDSQLPQVTVHCIAIAIALGFAIAWIWLCTPVQVTNLHATIEAQKKIGDFFFTIYAVCKYCTNWQNSVCQKPLASAPGPGPGPGLCPVSASGPNCCWQPAGGCLLKSFVVRQPKNTAQHTFQIVSVALLTYRTPVNIYNVVVHFTSTCHVHQDNLSSQRFVFFRKSNHTDLEIYHVCIFKPTARIYETP